MKKYVIIIASALLLLSCNENRNRRVQQIMREAEERAEGKVSDDSSSERVATEVIHDTIIVGDFPDSPRRPAPPSSVRPQRRANDDNMRGFDPASEDDLDDNGMRRYMENNDEEGWE